MKRLMTVAFATSFLCSCQWTFSTPSGLREHYRGLNGLTVPKATAKDDPYHELQRVQEEQRTLRLQLGRAE